MKKIFIRLLVLIIFINIFIGYVIDKNNFFNNPLRISIEAGTYEVTSPFINENSINRNVNIDEVLKKEAKTINFEKKFETEILEYIVTKNNSYIKITKDLKPFFIKYKTPNIEEYRGVLERELGISGAVIVEPFKDGKYAFIIGRDYSTINLESGVKTKVYDKKNRYEDVYFDFENQAVVGMIDFGAEDKFDKFGNEFEPSIIRYLLNSFSIVSLINSLIILLLIIMIISSEQNKKFRYRAYFTISIILLGIWCFLWILANI